MLPSRPKAGGGLPSGPRLRALAQRSDINDSQTIHSAPSSSRHRAEAPAHKRERSRSRSRPPLSRVRHTPARSYETQSEAGDSYRRSDDSTVSSASSLFERVKAAGAGYASSFTSVEDDFERREKPVTSSLRSRRLAESGRTNDESELQPHGHTLWNRVASAASEMTISVSKAWATNITTFSGEETPPGQESRLCRAMKAYHIEKARSPEDLPAWLFDEHERRSQRQRDTNGLGGRRDDEVIEVGTELIQKPRGLRDVYAAAASQQPSSQIRADTASTPAPTKATDRLRALRDAKRSVVPAVVEERPPSSRRQGLPTGPRRF